MCTGLLFGKTGRVPFYAILGHWQTVKRGRVADLLHLVSSFFRLGGAWIGCAAAGFGPVFCARAGPRAAAVAAWIASMQLLIGFNIGAPFAPYRQKQTGRGFRSFPCLSRLISGFWRLWRLPDIGRYLLVSLSVCVPPLWRDLCVLPPDLYELLRGYLRFMVELRGVGGAYVGIFHIVVYDCLC